MVNRGGVGVLKLRDDSQTILTVSDADKRWGGYPDAAYEPILTLCTRRLAGCAIRWSWMDTKMRSP